MITPLVIWIDVEVSSRMCYLLESSAVSTNKAGVSNYDTPAYIYEFRKKQCRGCGR